jgi:hypothetical protein
MKFIIVLLIEKIGIIERGKYSVSASMRLHHGDGYQIDAFHVQDAWWR